jgi:hypothetical protein
MFKNKCEHCNSAPDKNVRREIILFAEARCRSCGYMLVPKIFSLTLLKIVCCLGAAICCGFIVRLVWPDLRGIPFQIMMAIPMIIVHRIISAFSELKSFDI